MDMRVSDSRSSDAQQIMRDRPPLKLEPGSRYSLPATIESLIVYAATQGLSCVAKRQTPTRC